MEELERRVLASATALSPFDPARTVSLVMGPFAQTQNTSDDACGTPAVLVPTGAVDGENGGGIPSIDPSQLLATYQPVTLPAISAVLDPWYLVRYDALPVWHGLPTPNQIHQWQIGDCFLIAELQGMAQENPEKLMQKVIDYHDGTFGVTFNNWPQKGETIRVDGNFGGQQAVPTDAKWGVIIEKAYAVYRLHQSTYASLNGGVCGQVAWDLFWFTNGIVTGSDPSLFVTAMQAALATQESATAETGQGIAAGAPLIGSHAYSIVAVSFTPGVGAFVVMRNPWGIDGTGNDENPWDGLVTLTFEQYAANFWSTELAY